MEERMQIGEVLRIFRIIADKKIKEVSDELGIVSTYICDIEKCRKNLSLEKLKLFAQCYGIGADIILYIQEMSIKENWTFEKTLHMALIEWFKINEPEYLSN